MKRRAPILTKQCSVPGASIFDEGVSFSAIVTSGTKVFQGRTLHVSVEGEQALKYLALSIGTSLACAEAHRNNAGCVPARKHAAQQLRDLANQIDRGEFPLDNLGAAFREEMAANLRDNGVTIDNIWQIP